MSLDNGIMDEMILQGKNGNVFFHMEQMSKKNYWLRINDQEFDINLTPNGLEVKER